MREVAQKFWNTAGTYPSYGDIKDRRLHELNYLVPKLKGTKSMLDLGCGDGALIKCLLHLTNIEKYYAYEMSEALLANLEGTSDLIETKQFDCYEPTELPKADATVMAGVTTFLFEDEVVDNALSRIDSPVLYLREPCTINPEDEYINKYSEKLDSHYSGRYRTVDHLKSLIEKHFEVQDVSRAYPDELEHTPSTRQYYFEAKKLNE